MGDSANKELKKRIKDLEEYIKLQKDLEEDLKNKNAELTETNKKLQKEVFEHKILEERLKDSEEKYRILYHNSKDAFMIASPEEGFINGNPATVKMFGCKNEKEFISYSPTDLSPEYQPDGSLSALKAQELMHYTMDKGSHFFEWTHKKMNGEEFIANVFLTRVRLLDKTVLQATIRDITKNKKAEEDLHNSLKREELLADVFHNSSQPIVVAYPGGKLKNVNAAYCKLTGYDKNELLRSVCWTSTLTPEKWRKFESVQLAEAERSGKPARYEKEYIRKDGSLVPVELMVYPVFDESGKVSLYYASITDITERKRAEEELRKSENRYKILLDAITNYVYTVKFENGKPVKTVHSPRCIGVTGYSPGEYEADKSLWINMVHEEDRHLVKEQASNVFANNNAEPLEHRIIQKNGSIRWVRSTLVSHYDKSGNIISYDGIIEDITKRKEVEEILREKEYTIESATSATGTADLDGNMTYINPSFLKTWGFSSTKEIYGRHFSEFLEVKNKLDEIMNSLQGKGKWSGELKARKKSGRLFDVQVHASLVYNKKGEPISIMSSSIDITHRKRAENALLNSETKYKTLVQNISGMVYRAGPDWSAEIVSGCEEICGYTITELNSKDIKWLNVIHPDDKEIVFKEGAELVNEQKNIVQTYRIITKNGDIRWVEDYKTSLFSEQGDFFGIDGIVMDITSRKMVEEEKKKLEDQLFQSQKMESIGRLAGGIAHDYNNTLAGIMGYAEMLKMKFTDPGTFEGEAADVILQGAERAANLTRQLLGFARGGKYNPVILNINHVIKETVKLTEISLIKKIIVKYKLEKNVKDIKADNNQIQLILTNLILNAKDYMPDGGELLFETGNIFLDSEYEYKFTDFSPGNFVMFSVSDTGSGIAEEYLEKIFEPFFTTKEVGEGSGLGLATVFGIVRNHDGYIDVSSRVGEGTKFTLYIPVYEGTKETGTGRTGPAFSGFENKTVLVADDEDYIRNLAKLQLEHLGLKAISAEDGKEALNIFAENKNEIDLVLLDVIMPGIDGYETYVELKKMNPNVKTIVMSGFSKEGKASEILEEGAEDFIQKPFSLHQLSSMIRKVLRKE